MAREKFRVYYGPEDETPALPEKTASGETVTVQVAQVLPLLAEALLNKRAWLEDFEADEITLSTDLHDVLMAYDRFKRRPSA